MFRFYLNPRSLLAASARPRKSLTLSRPMFCSRRHTLAGLWSPRLHGHHQSPPLLCRAQAGMQHQSLAGPLSCLKLCCRPHQLSARHTQLVRAQAGIRCPGCGHCKLCCACCPCHCPAAVTHPKVIVVATSVPADVPCHVLQIVHSWESHKHPLQVVTVAVHRNFNDGIGRGCFLSRVQLLLTRVKWRKALNRHKTGCCHSHITWTSLSSLK